MGDEAKKFFDGKDMPAFKAGDRYKKLEIKQKAVRLTAREIGRIKGQYQRNEISKEEFGEKVREVLQLRKDIFTL